MENKNQNVIDEITQALENKEKEDKDFENSVKYVDISTFDIEKSSIKEQTDILKNIFSAVSTTEVVCVQSGYSAVLSALTYKDILTIMNANVSSYESKLNLFKTIYNKITRLSFCKNYNEAKPSFEEWLALTAYGDLDTLLFGLYNSTFQEKSTISFECPYCKAENVISINNSSLIQISGDRNKFSKLVEEIAQNSDSIEKMGEYSSISLNGENQKRNLKSFVLPDSQIVCSVKLPSMKDVLQVLKTISEDTLAQHKDDEISVFLTIYKILIKGKNDKYSVINDKKDVLQLMGLLSLKDISVLRQISLKMIEEKHIFYQINKETCSECKKDIFNIPIDIESLLFFQISEKQLI